MAGRTISSPSSPFSPPPSLRVRVKNSYNPTAPGTVISPERDMRDVLVTSIVLKEDVTLLDVVSSSMVGQYGFLARVFQTFAEQVNNVFF